MTPQFYTFTKSIRNFFSLHHAVLFIMIAGLLLSIAAYSLYETLLTQPPSTNDLIDTIGTFDQATVDKIKTLQDSGTQEASVALPSPRPNPFTE